MINLHNLRVGDTVYTKDATRWQVDNIKIMYGPLEYQLSLTETNGRGTGWKMTRKYKQCGVTTAYSCVPGEDDIVSIVSKTVCTADKVECKDTISIPATEEVLIHREDRVYDLSTKSKYLYLGMITRDDLRSYVFYSEHFDTLERFSLTYVKDFIRKV